EAWGIETGYRYEESPVICHEDGDAPPYEWERCEPTTWPGSRVPNVFLSDGAPLFDKLGTGFTLLSFHGEDASTLVDAANTIGLPMDVLPIADPALAEIYERKLVLVRPDQHVAWRGDEQPGSADEARAVLDTVRGA
ncbi:MAG: FAD-monooxygenase, partial [Pseudomonadota bacterium]